MKFIYAFGLLMAAVLFAACAKPDGGSATPSPVLETAPSARPSSASGSTIAVSHGEPAKAAATSPIGGGAPPGDGQTAGGLSWTASKRWTIGPERSMRAATYRIPAAPGDPEDGECAVFFFGPGQGGGVEANIERWVGQFEQPDGEPSSERARRSSETISGINVVTVDLTGNYKGGGPMMGSSTGSKTGYRLLGAIASGPQAGVFFKLTGPARTVTAAEKEFRAMLASLHQ